MAIDPQELRSAHQEDFTYEDYRLLIRAGKDEFTKKDKKRMIQLRPFFDRGLLMVNHRDEFWLTVKGVRCLQAVGFDPRNPHEFEHTYGHLLDCAKQRVTS